MKKIAIVTADFNSRYTHALRDGAKETLLESGLTKENVILKSVPGAFELPIVAKHLILNHKVDGVLCFGVVIRGETDHYDYVCKAATDGCLQVGLETMKPAMFGVLTVDTHKQLHDRIWGRKGHKGKEIAKALLDTLKVLEA